MCSLEKRIRDIIHFYVRENYNHYLTVNQITSIKDEDIPRVIDSLYSEKKEHIQVFVKASLKTMLKDDVPDEYIVTNLLTEVFRDDALCKNRITLEIKLHQSKLKNGKVHYSEVL